MKNILMLVFVGLFIAAAPVKANEGFSENTQEEMGAGRKGGRGKKGGKGNRPELTEEKKAAIAEKKANLTEEEKAAIAEKKAKRKARKEAKAAE